MMTQLRGLYIIEVGLRILCNKTSTPIIEAIKCWQRSFLHSQRIALPVRERKTELHLTWHTGILIDGEMIPVRGIKVSGQRRRLLSLNGLPMLIGNCDQFMPGRINENRHKRIILSIGNNASIAPTRASLCQAQIKFGPISRWDHPLTNHQALSA